MAFTRFLLILAFAWLQPASARAAEGSHCPPGFREVVRKLGANSGQATLPSPHKPLLESVLNPKDLKRVLQSGEPVSRSSWSGSDFVFTSAVKLEKDLDHCADCLFDHQRYPKISEVIKSTEVDPATGTLKISTSALGFKEDIQCVVSQDYRDEIKVLITEGKSKGTRITIHLYEMDGQTVALVQGNVPSLKTKLSLSTRLILNGVVDAAIGVGLKNLRKFVQSH